MYLTNLCRAAFIASVVYSCDLFAENEMETNFSGYARIVGGYLDDDAEYFGYGDSLSFEQNSLIGLQGQVKINDQLSITGLGILHSNSDIDSGVEWLYLSYRPVDALNIKIGQMQTPFYSLSDTLDVGYSYPFVIAPREVYSDFIFKKFQGIDFRYSFINQDFTSHLEVYYGKFDDEITVNRLKVDTEVDDLSGVIGEFRVDNFNIRASYHTGDVTTMLPGLPEFADLLSQSGFNYAADSLNTENGKADFSQLSFGYNSLDYLVKAEWVSIKLNQDIFSDVEGYYLTYGLYIDSVTALITYARRNDNTSNVTNEIPIGVSPQLDQLSFAYQAILDSRVRDDTESWTLGIRWDFADNLAFKTELKHIESTSDNSTTFTREAPNFDNKANLLLVALEWVF